MATFGWNTDSVVISSSSCFCMSLSAKSFQLSILVLHSSTPTLNLLRVNARWWRKVTTSMVSSLWLDQQKTGAFSEGRYFFDWYTFYSKTLRLQSYTWNQFHHSAYLLVRHLVHSQSRAVNVQVSSPLWKRNIYVYKHGFCGSREKIVPSIWLSLTYSHLFSVSRFRLMNWSKFADSYDSEDEGEGDPMTLFNH